MVKNSHMYKVWNLIKTIEIEAGPDIELFPKIEIKQYLSGIVIVCIKKIWKD